MRGRANCLHIHPHPHPPHQVVGAQDSVASTRSLVARLRSEAELLDLDDAGYRRNPQHPSATTTAAAAAAASSQRSDGASPSAEQQGGGRGPLSSSRRTAWRVLVALDHAALRLRRCV